MKTVLVCGLLFLGLLAGAPRANAQAKIGALAPDFTLSDSKGVSHSLAQSKGKFVVLEWLNPECPFVKKHYDSLNMQKLQKTYTDKGVVWYSIDSSGEGRSGHLTPELANKMMQERGAVPTAILLDNAGSVGKSYGARATPHMFVISPEGLLIYSGAIDDNDSTRLASVEGAKNYVVAALDQAMASKPVEQPSTEPYGCSIKYATS